MRKILFLPLAVISIALNAYAQAPKKVLFEEINGAWCGRVPFGDWIIHNYIVPNYPDVIPVFIHDSDTQNGGRYDLMASAVGDSIIDAFYVGVPYPSPKGIIDRMKFSDQTNVVTERDGFSTYNTTGVWKNKVITQLAVSSPVAVGITVTYNSITRIVNATVTTDFVAIISGDMRINLWIVEDSVVGSGYGYDQHTYDYNNSESPFYHVGVEGTNADSIPGYVHRHVLRGAASPAWGTAGVIPSSVSNGQNFSTDYTYTIPSAWDENQITLVAFVSYYDVSINNRSVLNAEKISLLSTTGINDHGNNLISIIPFTYPNPSRGLTSIEFSSANSSPVNIDIYNLLGENVLAVQKGVFSSGKNTVTFDAGKLESGVYLISVKTEAGANVNKLIIRK